MKKILTDYFVSEEWFLEEKRTIDETLSPSTNGEISVEEWSAQAKKIIREYIAADTRTIYERATSKDEMGSLLLEMMNRVQVPYFISRQLYRDFGLIYSEQELADLMRIKFPEAYALYLKRVYLMLKGDVIVDYLVKNYGKEVSEQFLFFVSKNKTNVIALGIEKKDFKFAINTACGFWSPSMMDQAAEKLESEV